MMVETCQILSFADPGFLSHVAISILYISQCVPILNNDSFALLFKQISLSVVIYFA